MTRRRRRPTSREGRLVRCRLTRECVERATTLRDIIQGFAIALFPLGAKASQGRCAHPQLGTTEKESNHVERRVVSSQLGRPCHLRSLRDAWHPGLLRHHALRRLPSSYRLPLQIGFLGPLEALFPWGLSSFSLGALSLTRGSQEGSWHCFAVLGRNQLPSANSPPLLPTRS